MRRRGKLGQARRLVTWFALGLVGLQLALAAALEWWRPDLRDPEYGNKLSLLRSRQAEAPDRPLFLVLGSSRVLNGLRPDRLDAPAAPGESPPLVFNFGLSRHGPVLELLALNRLLADGVRPRWAVVEVTPLLLPTGGAGLDAVPLERQKLTDLRLVREFDPAPRGLPWRWLAERAVPCYSNRYVLLSRYLPDLVPWCHREDFGTANVDRWGWLAMPEARSAEETRIAIDEVKRQHAPTLEQFAVAPQSDRAVRATLELCRREGIATGVILMPESAEFRSWYGPGAEGRLRDYLARLGAEFGVPVVDARDWCPDETFRDGHHLLPAGADRFTERFGREVMPAVVGAQVR
jgi:hypothetical protein